MYPLYLIVRGEKILRKCMETELHQLAFVALTVPQTASKEHHSLKEMQQISLKAINHSRNILRDIIHFWAPKFVVWVTFSDQKSEIFPDECDQSSKGKEQTVSITSLFHLTKENEPQAVVCFVLRTQQRCHLFIFSGTECCSVPTIVAQME